jgi:hypothetical protein
LTTVGFDDWFVQVLEVLFSGLGPWCCCLMTFKQVRLSSRGSILQQYHAAADELNHDVCPGKGPMVLIHGQEW